MRVQNKEAQSAAPTVPGSRDELSLIDGIRARAALLPQSGVRVGIGDDCALLTLRPCEEFAVTTDLSIEGRHFRLDWHSPQAIGHRALARGLSDLAAMGARPVAAFLSLGLPRSLTGPADPIEPNSLFGQNRSWLGQNGPDATGHEKTGLDESWLDQFLDGFFALAAQHRVPLAGGDLSESPIAMADIVLTGAVPKAQALLRTGARPGDRIYVTGRLGGAAAELAALANSPQSGPATREEGDHPHLYPQPRIAIGLRLRKARLASAAMDLSDGLSLDLARLCAASQVAAEIDAAKLPIHPTATLDQALHGGEDYELLFTAPAQTRVPRRIAGVPITEIGRILPLPPGQLFKPRLSLIAREGRQTLQPQAWRHFP